MKSGKYLFKNIFCALFLVLLVAGSKAFSATNEKELVKVESQERRDKRMQWWREAKFGMFIHWGLSAVPAGDGVNPNQLRFTPEEYQRQRAKYEERAQRFNPKEFDPADWVRVAKDAGMKYMVLTEKRHDGFYLHDSQVTDFDMLDATPYGKDFLKNLSRKCSKAGVKFGVYYSILDWHHPSQEPDYYKQETNEDSEEGWDKYSMNHMKEGRKEEYVLYM